MLYFGCISLFFGVVFSIMTVFVEGLDILAVGAYALAAYGICMAMLNDKKVDDNG
jgi:hypothetical protein